MEALGMIMQAFDTRDMLSEDIFDVITLIAAMQQAPPTNLKPQTYTIIKRQLNDAHFLANTGFTFTQFEAIHHALKVPNPVQTHEQDCVDSKTTFFLLCCFFQGQSLQSLEGQYGFAHSAISRLV